MRKPSITMMVSENPPVPLPPSPVPVPGSPSYSAWLGKPTIADLQLNSPATLRCLFVTQVLFAGCFGAVFILLVKGKVPPGCNLGPKWCLVPVPLYMPDQINTPISGELESHAIHYSRWLGLLSPLSDSTSPFFSLALILLSPFFAKS